MNEDALFKLLKSNDEINVRIAAEIVMQTENPDELWDKLLQRFEIKSILNFNHELYHVYMMSWQKDGKYYIDKIIFNKTDLE